MSTLLPSLASTDTDISIRRLLGGRGRTLGKLGSCRQPSRMVFVTHCCVVLNSLSIFLHFIYFYVQCFGWESSPISAWLPGTTGDHWRPPAMVMCLMRADSNNYNNRQRVAKTNPRPVPAIKQLKPLASQHSINCPISASPGPR